MYNDTSKIVVAILAILGIIALLLIATHSAGNLGYTTTILSNTSGSGTASLKITLLLSPQTVSTLTINVTNPLTGLAYTNTFTQITNTYNSTVTVQATVVNGLLPDTTYTVSAKGYSAPWCPPDRACPQYVRLVNTSRQVTTGPADTTTETELYD